MIPVAHRGCGAVFPENTVRAVRESAERLPAVEVDVRRCATGEVVVIHDETVDRVTDGTGAVADLSWDELRELRVQGSDERIPSLAEVVDAVPPDVTLQVELKETGLGRDVVEAVGARENVRLSSFLPDALREVADAGLETGYLFRDDPAGSLALAVELGCVNAHPHWETCRDTDVVERARDRDLGVIAWGAGTSREAVAAARAAGVDGLTVDDPAIV